MVSWYHFTSLKCGSPAGIWDLTVDGVYDLGGGQLVLAGTGTVDLDAATLTGPWAAQYRIDVTGVPALIGGQKAGLTGQASLADAVLSVYGLTGTGDFWSQTPALALSGAIDDPTKDFQLPVQSGQFC
jgi:hypothetical protein